MEIWMIISGVLIYLIIGRVTAEIVGKIYSLTRTPEVRPVLNFVITLVWPVFLLVLLY